MEKARFECPRPQDKTANSKEVSVRICNLVCLVSAGAQSWPFSIVLGSDRDETLL